MKHMKISASLDKGTPNMERWSEAQCSSHHPWSVGLASYFKARYFQHRWTRKNTTCRVSYNFHTSRKWRWLDTVSRSIAWWGTPELRRRWMTGWPSTDGRTFQSAGQGGGDPVSSSVSDFVENEVFAFQWSRWWWKEANFQNRMNLTPWESNPFPFKILQFWQTLMRNDARQSYYSLYSAINTLAGSWSLNQICWIFLIWEVIKTLVVFYRDYTTQLYRDYNKPINGSLLAKLMGDVTHSHWHHTLKISKCSDQQKLLTSWRFVGQGLLNTFETGFNRVLLVLTFELGFLMTSAFTHSSKTPK